MMNLPSFGLLRVAGPDAARHLHGQLACEVLALPPGEWRFGAYCQVDGRVEALFVIARADVDAFELLLPRELGLAVRSRLERYRLRARCVLDLTDVAIAAEPTDGASGLIGPGLDWWLTVVEDPIPIPAPLWERQIELGTPWLRAATGSLFLPQMLGLAELGAISLKKGCYPGQEIVARTHYLGRSKRHLARLAVRTGYAPPGSPLLRDGEDQPCGILLESDHRHALAVLAESVPDHAPLATSPAPTTARFEVIDKTLAKKRNPALNQGQRRILGA
jgi:folate-binding protein YgfZ